MRILFLSIVPSPYQRDLFAELHQLDDVEIAVRYAEAASPDSPWPAPQLADYEKVYRSFYLSLRGKRFIVNARLPSVRGFDAVVLNGYMTIPAQWVLRTAAHRVPLIFWGEKMESAQTGLLAAAQRFLTRPLNGLSAIIAIGKKAKRDYEQRFAGIPVHEVPYFCRIDNFQGMATERPADPVRILFCGQMIERKGVDLLLAAFSRLVEDGQRVELTLVGREAELPQMLAAVPPAVREHIHFAGFQAPDDLPRYFAAADIFVLPSRYDGWGVVVNQALGAGLPVICSDAVGAAEDLVLPGENGYLFASGDADELHKVLAQLANSPDQIRNFAKRSLQLAEKLSPEFGARALKQILRTIVSQSS